MINAKCGWSRAKNAELSDACPLHLSWAGALTPPARDEGRNPAFLPA